MITESHAHIFMNGIDYPKARDLYCNGITDSCREDIRAHLSAYRDHGVTYVRDGGDPYGACLEAKSMAQEYGIEYRIPVFALHRRGSYGAIVGHSFGNMQEYRELVKKADRMGADFIKVMFSGIMDFAGTGGVTGEPAGREEIREMIRIAHGEGFAVMAHVNGDRTIRDALECGVDSIEHGNFMTEETLRVLAECDAVWVPTNVTIHNLIHLGRFEQHLLEKLDRMQEVNIRQAFALGARIAAGSDAGAYGVLHGRGIRDERARLREIAGDGTETERWLSAGEEWLRQRFRR